MNETKKIKIKFSSLDSVTLLILLFLWLLLCIGKPDLHDAILYNLSRGAIPLPTHIEK